MVKGSKIWRAGLSSLAFLALAAAAPSPHGGKAQTLADAAPYIDRANDEWTRAIVTGDAEILSAPYAADGIFITPDGRAIRGKAAVRAMYGDRSARVKVLSASIRSDGRAAHDPENVYEWGTARMRVEDGNVIRQASGRYLTAWHREGKKWVIARNIAF